MAGGGSGGSLRPAGSLERRRRYLAEMVVKTAHPGDHILVMSNGGFGGIHQKLLDKLAQKAAAAE